MGFFVCVKNFRAGTEAKIKHHRSRQEGYLDIFVPRLFEDKRGDMVFIFPWGVMRGSEFVVGTL